MDAFFLWSVVSAVLAGGAKVLTNLAGLPANTTKDFVSLVTTAPAAIWQPLPIFAMMMAPSPTHTLAPTVTCLILSGEKASHSPVSSLCLCC